MASGNWASGGICLLAAILPFGSAEAQRGSLELRHVRWPLLDMVMVTDSASLWFLAGPNPATTLWESGSHLASLRIDPVLALQWVTVARKLLSFEGRSDSAQPAHLTPPLPAQRGPKIILLAANPKKSSTDRKFVLLVSDSARDTRWKSFASSAQVDTFLTALDAAARAGWEGSRAATWNTLADRDPDQPIKVVSQPKPAYPGRLASGGRIGRVWMSFVVTAEGRADPLSFFPLLSDDSLFTGSAKQALLRGRYQAAVTNGQPVPQRVFQAILFRQR